MGVGLKQASALCGAHHKQSAEYFVLQFDPYMKQIFCGALSCVTVCVVSLFLRHKKTIMCHFVLEFMDCMGGGLGPPPSILDTLLLVPRSVFSDKEFMIFSMNTSDFCK